MREESGRHAAHADTLGFGRLFHVLRDAVVVADASGRIVLWNPAAERMFGWTPEEVVGRSVDILIPSRLRADHEAGMDRWRATGHGAYIDRGVPLGLPALKRDGTEIAIEMSLSPFERDGERYATAILRDVTERAALTTRLQEEDEALRRANAALVEANRALEAFTYVVSHDLKEPVRAMEAYLQVLGEAGADRMPPEAVHAVRRAEDAARRLRTLLTGLLEVARHTGGPLVRERVDVADLLRSDLCVTHFQDLLAERGASLEVRRGIPPVLASPGLLCQVLGNVVANAVKHRDAGGAHVRVSGRRAPDGRVEVDVDDDGPGFPEAVVRAFEHARSATSPGGGFGLVIARRAVERLGGTMHLARSDLGGARVKLVLPSA